MNDDDLPAVYDVTLRIEDPVFFSTEEMNKRVVTGRFLHNYALTYALIHAGSSLELLTDYSRRYERRNSDGPKYQEDLAGLPFYIFPASPQAVSHTSEIVNTKSERHEAVMTGDRGKQYFSAHELRRIGVGSTLRTFIIAENDESLPLTSPIRLGKFRSKVRVEADRQTISKQLVESIDLPVTLNTVDLSDDFAARIANVDIRKMRPTPIVTHATYSGEAYVGSDSDVILPADIHYFGAQS